MFKRSCCLCVLMILPLIVISRPDGEEGKGAEAGSANETAAGSANETKPDIPDTSANETKPDTPNTTANETIPDIPDTNVNETKTDTPDTNDNETKGESTKQGQSVTLTVGDDDSTPKNVVTDRYGKPVKKEEIMNITLPDGEVVTIYTEKWLTYYTVPATKPGCHCLTRGPLSRFKLIGNIHWPRIKIKTRPPVYATTETSTICPPCPPCARRQMGNDENYDNRLCY